MEIFSNSQSIKSIIFFDKYYNFNYIFKNYTNQQKKFDYAHFSSKILHQLLKFLYRLITILNRKYAFKFKIFKYTEI